MITQRRWGAPGSDGSPVHCSASGARRHSYRMLEYRYPTGQDLDINSPSNIVSLNFLANSAPGESKDAPLKAKRAFARTPGS